MATHPGMLIAYNDDGDVVGTLDYMVVYDDTPERNPLGLVDFSAVEESGEEMTAVWDVEAAKGSKVWPEYIGGRAHEFAVELAGPPGRKRISALVHKESGHRRERAVVEAAIAARVEAAGPGGVADIRDLVGGPDRPMNLDDHGRSAERRKNPAPSLPLVRSK